MQIYANYVTNRWSIERTIEGILNRQLNDSSASSFKLTESDTVFLMKYYIQLYALYE